MLTQDFADFTPEEYAQRLTRLRMLMTEASLDAILLTTDSNHRYFTGHWTHRWMHKYTALFALLPREQNPVLLVPPIEAGMCAWDSWVEDVRTYTAGRAQAGVGTITEVIRELKLDKGRIGAELGGVLWMRMPFQDFGQLQQNLPQVEFVDTSPLLWKLRFRKSPAEVGYIRKAVTITDAAYQTLFTQVKSGMTEREIHRLMSVQQLLGGAELPGSITPASHSAQNIRSCERSHRRHSDRVLQIGDLAILDAGCVYRGYWSDYTRMFALGRASTQCQDAYRVIYECMHDAINVMKPGAPIADMVRVVMKRLQAAGYTEQAERATNIGHASGLDIIEPPFIARDDPTILEEGMILTVEPSMYTDYGFFMLEEDVLVTDHGYEILSTPASDTLPII
jgi:Xaa-Pro aminopeptidase